MKSEHDLEAVIAGLARRQALLAGLIEQERSPRLLGQLLAVYGQNAARLGRLIHLAQGGGDDQTGELADWAEATLAELEARP